MILRHHKVRYKGSFLGALWTILHPLAFLAIFLTIFSIVIRLKIENYPIYLLSGLLPWIFFQTSVSGGIRVLLDSPNLVKKVYFPKRIIPLSFVFSNLTNLFIGFVILLFACLLLKIPITLKWIGLFPLTALLFIFIIGLVYSLSSLNIFYRDIEHIVEIILTLLFYLSPIFYSTTMVPKILRKIYLLNPIASFLEVYRYIILGRNITDPSVYSIIIVWSFILYVIGWFIQEKLAYQFAKKI